MRSVAVTWLACLMFWTLFGACVDQPPPPAAPLARLVAAWDATTCGEPHRVEIELYDDDGVELSRSAPCAIGMVQIDVPHLGSYHGRVYAWTLGGAIADEADVAIDVDQQIVHWQLPSTP